MLVSIDEQPTKPGYLEWIDALHGLDRGNQIGEVTDR